MMIVIGRLTARLPTIDWYSRNSGSVNSTMPTRIAFIGRSRSVCESTTPVPARAAASPLLTPDSSDLRIEISAQTPPTSIAPTPR